MRNRAKCKLCSSIIESFHSTDYVMCKCEEIAVDGGAGMNCFAKHWENFFRVDDKDNEIPVRVQEEAPKVKPTKKELIEMLKNMKNAYQNLPDSALTIPLTHYDFVSLLLLLDALFEEDLG